MKHTASFLLILCTGLTVPQIVSAQYYCEQPPVIKLCLPAYVHQPHCDFSDNQYREIETVHEIQEVTKCITPTVPKVIYVQRYLTRCGYFQRGQHPAIGVCDGQTVDAIRGFQRSKGLPVTGVVDEKLLAAMEKDPSNENASAGKSPAANPAPTGAPTEATDANAAETPAPTAAEPASTEESNPAPVVDNTKTDTVPEKTAPTESKAEVDEILVADEVAKLLRVEEKDVIDLFEKAELPGKKIGDAWRTTRSSVLNYLNAK